MRKSGLRVDYETGNVYLRNVWDALEIPKEKNVGDIDEQIEDAEEEESDDRVGD